MISRNEKKGGIERVKSSQKRSGLGCCEHLGVSTLSAGVLGVSTQHASVYLAPGNKL